MIKPVLFLFLSLAPLIAFEVGGVVLDRKTHLPIQNAKICDAVHCVKSGKSGKFHIKTTYPSLHIKALGYRPYRFKSKRTEIKHFLRPIRVQALYLTFWGASPSSKTFNRVLALADKTKINAVVVDVKNEYGNTSYKTDVTQANANGAWHKRTIKNIGAFLHTLKEHDIYTIARIVVFKDELQAANNPDYAIRKKQTRAIWRNADNMAWVDPFDKRSWKYTVDIAVDAAKRGFDEINFDYIRFPAKEDLLFQKESNEKNRTETIAAFLEYAKKRLSPYGVFLSVDTYGNVLWSKDDNNIGQRVDIFAKHADYLCPMLYPSGFAYGSFGFKYPATQPYEVNWRSIRHVSEKIDPTKVRPWIQAFRDYTKKRHRYDAFEIKEQIAAADDLNTDGWILWSPSSRYKLSYFLTEEEEHSKQWPSCLIYLQDNDLSTCKTLLSD